MSDPTGTPAPALLANALRVLADMAGTLYVRQPDGLTVVQLLAHEQDERYIILGAMSGIEHTDQPVGAGQLHTWRGFLAGWQLQLVQWVPAPAAPDALAVSAQDAACGSLGCCLGHCRGPAAELDERDRFEFAAVDTSPATAAAEQPAGLASSWPPVAAVPAPRPPADMLPAPSWALVGLESAFTPLVTPVPLTDPALAGREQTAEVA